MSMQLEYMCEEEAGSLRAKDWDGAGVQPSHTDG